MSGYPDDRFDEPRPIGPREMAEAKASVRFPATLLIVTGVLAILAAAIGLIQLPKVPAQMDQMIEEIEADQQMEQKQKDSTKKILTSIKEQAQEPYMPGVYIASIVCGLLVVVGGIKLFNLSGRALPMLGSVLAMIPCTVGCCCVIGLPAGIWSIVVLNRPNIRAAMAASRYPAPARLDDPYQQ